jgi:hypothetical protein
MSRRRHSTDEVAERVSAQTGESLSWDTERYPRRLVTAGDGLINSFGPRPSRLYAQPPQP